MKTVQVGFPRFDFAVAFSCLLATVVFYFFGNPLICTYICWHHVPEVAAMFFFGRFMHAIGASKKACFAVYFFVVLGTWSLFLSISLFDSAFGFSVMYLSTFLLASPLLISYFGRKKK